MSEYTPKTLIESAMHVIRRDCFPPADEAVLGWPDLLAHATAWTAAIKQEERLGTEVEQWRAEHADATAPSIRPMTKMEHAMMDMMRDFGFDVGFWREWAIRLEPRLSFLAEVQHLTNEDVDAAQRLLAVQDNP